LLVRRLIGANGSAIALLEEAVTAGYDNFQQMRTDHDLESLWEMEAFKELTHQ